MRDRGKKGAEATKKRFQAPGMASEELGTLRTHQDAKRWLESIGRAVVTGRLGNREATAGIRSVEAWLKAEGERVTMQVVEELRAEVERLKEGIRTQGQLTVV